MTKALFFDIDGTLVSFEDRNLIDGYITMNGPIVSLVRKLFIKALSHRRK